MGRGPIRPEGLCAPGLVLAIDGIEGIPDWTAQVKKEWDADTFSGTNGRAVLSGTPVAMLRKDLTESLFGRFEEIRMAQWRYPEMMITFGTSISE